MNYKLPTKEEYLSAPYFPHTIIDDFAPEGVAMASAVQFPDRHEIRWHSFNNPREKKLAFNDLWTINSQCPDLVSTAMDLIHPDFCQRLSEMTGIEGLVPDPTFLGGGLHRIEDGGFLNIHTDFNFHPHLKKKRVLNLLLFLNDEWDDTYGGNLELWSPDTEECIQRIVPKFNRAVIFTLSDTSWHGHPVPLQCPSDRARKSLALYYYAGELPLAEERRSTIFINPKGGQAARMAVEPI